MEEEPTAVDTGEKKKKHKEHQHKPKKTEEELNDEQRQRNIEKFKARTSNNAKQNICKRSSFLGPAPCHLESLFCCVRLRRSQTASLATKIAYLFFLGLVIVIACFFVIPYPESISLYPPCLTPKSNFIDFGGWWGTCRGHAGYFMVYRIFFAAICIFAILGLLLLRVQSTEDCCRPGLHQGYWLWKIIIFIILLCLFIFLITLDSNAIFDEALMFMGLICAFLFAFPTLVFILDVCELAVIKFKKRCKCCQSARTENTWLVPYWALTFFVYVFDGLFIGIVLIKNYTSRQTGLDDDSGGPIPIVNYGSGNGCPVNIILIVYCFGIGCFVTVVAALHFFRKCPKYPNTGFLQSGVVFGHTIVSVYLAMGNSSDVECRLVWYPWVASSDTQDVTLTAEGLIYSVFVLLTLGYFTLLRGPLGATAPLSILFMHVLSQLNVSVKHRQTQTDNISAKKANSAIDAKSKEPTANKTTDADQESVSSYSSASDSSQKYDRYLDETEEVAYSWSFFHIFLILGSFSMMLGMTNFFRPLADGPNVSNNPAFWFKFLMSPFGVALFVVPLLIANVSPISPQSSFTESAPLGQTDEELGIPSEPAAETEPIGTGEKTASFNDTASSDVSSTEPDPPPPPPEPLPDEEAAATKKPKKAKKAK